MIAAYPKPVQAAINYYRQRLNQNPAGYLDTHNAPIVASNTPYSPSHLRLTPSIYNSPQEIDQTLGMIRELASFSASIEP